MLATETSRSPEEIRTNTPPPPKLPPKDYAPPLPLKPPNENHNLLPLPPRSTVQLNICKIINASEEFYTTPTKGFISPTMRTIRQKRAALAT